MKIISLLFVSLLHQNHILFQQQDTLGIFLNKDTLTVFYKKRKQNINNLEDLNKYIKKNIAIFSNSEKIYIDIACFDSSVKKANDIMAIIQKKNGIITYAYYNNRLLQ